MKQFKAEVYRIYADRSFRWFFMGVLFVILIEFIALMIIGRYIAVLPKELLNEFRIVSNGYPVYNFGIIKIPVSDSINYFRMDNALAEIMTTNVAAASIAVLIPVYAAQYQKRSLRFMAANQMENKKVICSCIFTSVILGNVVQFIFEIFLGVILAIHNVIYGIDMNFSVDLFLWLLCLHLCTSVYSMFVLMVSLLLKKCSVSILVNFSFAIMGEMVTRIMGMVTGDIRRFSDYWILNYISGTAIENFRLLDSKKLLLVAITTMAICTVVTAMELSYNKKEKYN